MKIITLRKAINSAFTLITLTFCLTTQSQNSTVNQDPKFEQLLNEKRKINSSITVNDRYKIQIFNGNSENSKKKLIEFKRENKR